LRRSIEHLRTAIDRLSDLLEEAASNARALATAGPAPERDARALARLTPKQRFPFGVWRSTDAVQRFTLDFSDNGCAWIERNTSGDILRRQVALEHDGSAWIVRRENDAEVLAFLGVAPPLASEILARSPAASFLRIDLPDDHVRADWHGLGWRLDPKGRLKALEQPGSASAPESFTLEYEVGSDDRWFRPGGPLQLTFDQEGQEGVSLFHSRWLQWPGGNSGVTLGRGHDMKERTAASVRAELCGAGVAPTIADAFAAGAGLAGTAARDFVAQQRERCGNITPAQQWRLFRADYATLEADTRRICRKPDVVARYGAVDFTTLDARIWAVTVDLRFRGDYTTASRKVIQKAIADNDLAAFRAALSSRANWPGVPPARFNARVAALADGSHR